MTEETHSAITPGQISTATSVTIGGVTIENGEVTLPAGVSLEDASLAFWKAVERFGHLSAPERQMIEDGDRPICDLVWEQARVAVDDVIDYYRMAGPGDVCVDGSPPFPVWRRPTDVVQRLARYLTHDVGCSANDLDHLDHTPCTCGLRALYNPKGTAMPEIEAHLKQYTVGPHTMRAIFHPAGLTNISDLQAVFDAAELALTPSEDPATEGIRIAAKTIRDWMPTTLPTDEGGKLHFGRVIAEAAADEIEKFIVSKRVDVHSTLADLRKFVDTMEARSMACDGPVTPFLEEIHVASDVEKERFMEILRALYAAAEEK